jgi:H+/Cl- antiporter ClcA
MASRLMESSAKSRWQESLFSVRALRRHSVWILAAVATGAVAALFRELDDWSVLFSHWLATVSPWIQPAMLFFGMILICQLRDRFFQGTDGTGIPQAIAALKIEDGPARGHVLSWRILVGKGLLLAIGLFAGMTIGREGPSVHAGACFMYLSNRWGKFQTWLVQRGLILAGGAAGIAAAFNTPIAGAIFALEEIGRSFEKENAGTIVRTVLVACLVCVALFGDYLFYGKIETRLDQPLEWLVVPVLGVVFGLLGGLFAQSLLLATRPYGRFYHRRPLMAAASLGAAMALLAILSDGFSYGSGYPHAQAILMEGTEVPTWGFGAIALGNWIALLSGIPGGLFDPSLATGAALGQLTAPFLEFMDPQAVILLCMVSYFAGVVQSPITAFVILVEMTDARFMTLPLALAAMLAFEASRLVCPTALYEGLAENFLTRLRPPENKEAPPA